MLGSLIVGVIAGYLVPVIEPKLKAFMEKVALSEVKLDPNEFDLLTLIVMLIAGAAFCGVFGIDTSAFLLVVGAGVGLFGKRISDFVVQKVIRAERTREDA
ncbi:hypothetical protein [Pseudaestuariivita rosea]|uniref:hypothetical protein n=1 Tax=Pseudaestuariivita rosea TaxID=2763263 RepID=UPI001ABBCF74|nr:hypothetical protein [Pseudaestuariivita rosea]